MALEWENKPTIVGLEANLNQLLETFTELADSVNGILQVISSGLTGVKAFLIDDINPLLLALEFILDQMLVVIDQFRNTGLYILSMYPSKETHSRWYRGNRTEKILFRDLLPGFAKPDLDSQGNPVPRSPERDSADPSGFYILQQKDAFDLLYDSFDDLNDLNRPPTPGVNQVSLVGTRSKRGVDMATSTTGTTGRWFKIFGVDNETEYVVWYNYSGKNIAPVVTGASLIEVSVGIDDTAKKVLDKTISATNGIIDFTVSGTGRDVKFFYNSVGPSSIPVDGNVPTGFTFQIQTHGQAGTTSDLSLGAIIIFAGALTSDQLATGNLLEDTFEAFQKIGQLMADLFDIRQFKQMVNDMASHLDVIADAKEAAAVGSIRSQTPVQSKTMPNWNSQQLTKLIPPLGTALDSIEGLVQGLKDSISGADSAIQAIIDYIDQKIQDIIEIQTAIQDFLDYIDNLNGLIEELGKFEFATLYIPPTPGGINVLKSAIKDNTLAGRPSEDLFYCALTCMIATGTGFNFMAYLLGLTDSFETGADATVFSQDAIKEQYGID